MNGVPPPRAPPRAAPSTPPPAAPPSSSPPSPPIPLSERPHPTAALALLFVSLLGFLLIALLLYEFKVHGTTQYFHGFPTRDLFVGALALAAAPYFLTVFRRVPALFLVAPAVLVFFLYPIFSPHGFPFSRDPIFNFQFAQAVANSTTWTPLAGVTGQAGTYSYYPGGAVYSATLSSLTTLPVLQTFDWGYYALRLLVVPLSIYAIAARLFSSRSAPLAVLLYLGIPSIEFNIPTQQDFAITWFILALTVLAFLATANRSSTFLQITLVVFCTVVLISHHVSTYVLLAWLGGLALLPLLLKGRDPYPSGRTAIAFFRTLATVLLWAVLVTLPVLQQQTSILARNLALLLHPVASRTPGGAARGSTFPIYQDVWIALAIAFIVFLALLTLAESYRREERSFLTFSVLTGFLIVLFSIPFLFTGFNFLLLRILEFTGVVLAPAAAFWLVHRVSEGQAFPRRAGAKSRPPRTLEERRRRRAVGAAVAVGLAVLIFTGGSLVPLSTRDQFAGPKGILIDSPLFINQSAFEAVHWATTHLNQSQTLWGDELVYSTFGAFGGFDVRWNSYKLFNATVPFDPTVSVSPLAPYNVTVAASGFNSSQVSLMHTGQYIVTDIYLTTIFLPPEFPGPPSDQPSTALNVTDLARFSVAPFFSVVYVNSIFTVIRIEHVPPADTGT